MTRIFLFINVIFTFFVLPAHAKTYNQLQGPAFSDPDIKTEMDKEWLKQPIKYEEWGEGADVVIYLNQHIYTTAYPLVKKYAKDNNLTIIIKEGTCGYTKGGLYNKTIDIGMMCCPPHKIDRLPGLSFHTIGIEPIGLFINQQNSVNNVTFSQAQKIFTGEIKNWSEVNGPDQPISVYIRPHCAIKPGLWHRLLKNKDLFSFRALEPGSIKTNVTMVAQTPEGIGFDNLWQVYNYKLEHKIKFLKINGFDPENPKHLAANLYPLYQTYNIALWNTPELRNPSADKLVTFLKEQTNNGYFRKILVPADTLRESGWKFRDDELIGEPEE